MPGASPVLIALPLEPWEGKPGYATYEIVRSPTVDKVSSKNRINGKTPSYQRQRVSGWRPKTALCCAGHALAPFTMASSGDDGIMTHVFDPNNTWMFKSFTPKFGPEMVSLPFQSPSHRSRPSPPARLNSFSPPPQFQGRLPGTVCELTRPEYKIVVSAAGVCWVGCLTTVPDTGSWVLPSCGGPWDQPQDGAHAR